MTQRAPDINYVGGISRRVEGRCVGGETRYLRARTCGHESIGWFSEATFLKKQKRKGMETASGRV